MGTDTELRIRAARDEHHAQTQFGVCPPSLNLAYSYRKTYYCLMSKLPNILSVSEARTALKALMERVTADKMPAIITRRGGEPVVMVSLSEWEAIQETNYLLDNPANARRLREAVAAAEEGETRTLTPQQLRGMAEDPSVFLDWLDETEADKPAR